MFALIRNNVVVQYPYTVTDLRRAHPSTSFSNNPGDDTLAEFGMLRVFFTPQPQGGAGQVVVEGAPAFDGERWNQTWVVRDKTSAEIAAETQALQAGIVQATQDRLDAFARTRHYDDIKSASDYAGCTVPKFDLEGTYCRDIRALTWDALYRILGEVQAGTRPMPTGFADIEPDLPALAWPEV